MTSFLQAARGRAITYSTLGAIALTLGGCSVFEDVRESYNHTKEKAQEQRMSAEIDRYTGLTRAEYKNELLPQRKNENETVYFPGADTRKRGNAAPDISPILVAPRPPSFGTDKLVTLTVTDDIPIRDVLIEMAHNADVDMEVDPGISGGIILSVKDKPFSRVIDRIARLAGLRYEYRDGILRVERDLPYQYNYAVDFLNLTRSGQSNISINTQVLGAGGDGLSGGSGNTINSSYEGDIWNSLAEGIRGILDYTPTNLVSNLATGAGGFAANNSYNINRQAGVLTVTATERQHELIRKYLAKVKESVSSQVLIEAKIVEVTLDDKYNTGIDWGVLADQNLGIQISGDFSPNLGADNQTNVLAIQGLRNLKAAVRLTEQFGTSRTISSPRLHAMNNQQAILTFAENFVYFTIEVEEETRNDGTQDENSSLTIDSQLNTVPIGVILVLQPSINLETQEVTMNIRPTLSRITDTVSDPAVALTISRSDDQNIAGTTSEIPVIEVRELDSVLKIKSGQVMVIGGLMREISVNNDAGVPYLSSIPYAGNLFKSVKKETEVIETIIFIKATIVPSRGVSAEDQRIYNKFVPHDPRPLTF